MRFKGLKFISLLIISAICLFMAGGQYLLNMVQKKSMESSFIQRMESDQNLQSSLLYLKLSVSEFDKAMKWNGEMEIQGEIFDIIHCEKQNNIVELVVWNDSADMNLLKQTSKDSNTEKTSLPEKILIFLQQIELNHSSLSVINSSINILPTDSDCFLYKLNHSVHISMPPEMI